MTSLKVLFADSQFGYAFDMFRFEPLCVFGFGFVIDGLSAEYMKRSAFSA